MLLGLSDMIGIKFCITADYTALPTCTAYSGIDATGVPNKLLVLDGYVYFLYLTNLR